MIKKLILLDIIELKIPFKVSFKHNSAERNTTQSVIVIAGDGECKGYGESCPREYVTAESIDTVFNFFNAIRPSLMQQVNDLGGLHNFIVTNKDVITKNPSAWCAIELSLLDLFAKQNKCSIEKLLNKPELEGTFFYTAVIGDGSLESFTKIISQYIKMGFNDFKIKISGDPVSDYEKFLLLTKLTEGKARMRIDANNIWSNIADAAFYINNIPVPIFAIEEPLLEKNISDLLKLSSQIKIPVILDESFNNIDQLEQLTGYNRAFIINLRVSKMGGLLRSIALAEDTIKKEIDIIIGAQVGETSILTRAGLCVANSIKPNYKAMEGGFGTLLLEHDITETPLMFAKGGELDPALLLDKGIYGFQLKIMEGRIRE